MHGKHLLCLLLCLLLTVACVSALAEPQLVFEKETLEIEVGRRMSLKPSVEGAKAGKYPDYQYQSANPDIASVNDSGSVKAVGEGRTTITCTLALKDGPTLEKTCEVYCYIPVTKLHLSQKEMDLCVGQTYALQPAAEPQNATDKTVTFVSSDESVCTVDENGVITAHTPGKSTITCTALYGKQVTARLKVTVPTFSISQTQLTLTTPEAVALPVTYNGEDVNVLKASVKTKDIVDISLENGVLTVSPVGAGETAITVSDPVGRSKITVQVTVQGTAIPPQEQVRVSTVSLTRKGVQIHCRNRTGVPLTSITWRVQFVDETGSHYGSTDAANYARGKEVTLFVDDFEGKKLGNGNTRTLSYDLPTFGYEPVKGVLAALSGYTTADGDTVCFSEEQLTWISSQGGSTPGVASPVSVPLTAQEQALADQNTIGWKTRLLTPEHAKRLGYPDCGLMLYGFFANNNAEKNGFKMYDVITEVNGLSFARDPYLPDRVLQWHAQGDHLEFTVVRGGVTMTLALN